MQNFFDWVISFPAVSTLRTLSSQLKSFLCAEKSILCDFVLLRQEIRCITVELPIRRSYYSMRFVVGFVVLFQCLWQYLVPSLVKLYRVAIHVEIRRLT